MQRIKIGSRVHLNYVKFTKGKTDRVSVCFRDTLSEKTAALDAIVFPVLMNGAEKYPDMMAFSRKMQELYGGSMSAFNIKRGASHVIGVAETFLNSRYTLEGEDNLSEAIKVLAECIFNPLSENGVFKGDFIEIEKNNLIADIKAEINDKAGYARAKCIELMCGDDPYKLSVNGTVEEARRITPESAFENYKRVLGEVPVEIFYCGGETVERVVECFKLYFPFSSNAVEEPVQSKLIKASESPLEGEEQMTIKQGKLSLGFTTGIGTQNPLLPAMVVFSVMYGGIPTSKLFMNVREKLSLCYTCSCSYAASKGIIVANAGIDFDKRETAQAEMLAQLAQLQSGNFTDEELETAKNSLATALKSVEDGAGDIASWWLDRICSNRLYSPAEMIEKYEKVSREDVIKAGENVKLKAVFFLSGKGCEDA